MTATLRLFWIEARHNVALLLAPMILLVSWWMLDSQLWEPYLWDSTNELLQKSVVPLAAPAIAGAAAWMASRNRRRGIQDLVATTPRPAMRRHLTLLAATALWGMLAYLLVAGYMFSRTAPHATWSGPKLWPVALLVAAILAHAAWGYLAGHLFSSRFTAPLVAIGAFGVQQFAAGSMTANLDGSQSSTWVSRLAAQSVMFTLAPWQALFYAGLTLTALAALALLIRRDALSVILASGAIVIAVAGVVMVWGETPRWNEATGTVTDAWGNTIIRAAYVPPEPVCRGDTVIVCAHPQFQPWLDAAVTDAEALAQPLVGLPGLPVPIECKHTGFGSRRNEGSRIDISGCTDQLVADDATLDRGQIQNKAQMAIRVWLLDRIHANTMCGFPIMAGNRVPPGLPTKASCDASDRFAALPEADQRVWLGAHYAALRAGDLTLADLP